MFVLVTDYIMKKVVNGKLLDLDYADYIILICNRPEEIKEYWTA